MTITIGKKTAALVATVATVVAAGAAFAAWSTSTSGDASAKAATATALTLADASASTTGDLYPGGTGALKLKVANPNPFPVRVTAVTGNGAITSDTTGCNSTNHGVTFTDQTGQTIDLAANAAAAVVTLAGAVQMSTSAANACQGATFTIPVTVTAASH
jgi:hypothetical protein